MFVLLKYVDNTISVQITWVHNYMVRPEHAAQCYCTHLEVELKLPHSIITDV
jgi:hypothetical protein